MSLITSCPACGTMFRVVPDQLKISEGWVRCGHCGEVFDATAHLSDESILAEPATAQAASAPGNPQQPRVEQVPPPPQAPPPTQAPPSQAPRMPRPVAPPPPAPAATSAPADPSSFFGDSQSLEASPLDRPFVFRRSDLVLPDQGASIMPPQPPEAHEGVPYDDEEHERIAHRAPEIEQVSFVRQARRKAFWRRPLVRIMLSLVSLALAALLLLQLAYRDRDRLALAEPALRPALVRMCVLLRCQLGPPRQIESIVIESSGFNRLRNDTYRLSFTLRNSARVPVEAPAMELTITDAQDQPLARRVLTPAELGAAGQPIPPLSDWGRSLGVVLSLPGSARVAGYRLLAFYP
jgi:predicted Zn finger-like uncharacterized protein